MLNKGFELIYFFVVGDNAALTRANRSAAIGFPRLRLPVAIAEETGSKCATNALTLNATERAYLPLCHVATAMR
jgi:hypothetical protein